MKFLMIFFFLVSVLGGSFDSHAEADSHGTTAQIEHSLTDSHIISDCSERGSDHDEEPCSDNCHTHGHCHCMFLEVDSYNKKSTIAQGVIPSKEKFKIGSFSGSLFRPPIS